MQQNVLIILALIIILLCSCLALGSGVGLGLSLGQQLNDPPPTTAAATPSAYQPPERPAQRGRLLFEDDFSQPTWQVDDQATYQDEQYAITVEAENYSYWAIAGENLADFVLEVDTHQLSGPDDNDYGVLLRYQDEANFYSFEISGDGYYTFTKLVDDELYDIIPWQESQAIHQGNNHNTIQVEAVGPDFTFYVNGKLIDTAIDAEFSQGDIGLLAGTYDQGGVRIAFDNLKLWAVD